MEALYSTAQLKLIEKEVRSLKKKARNSTELTNVIAKRYYHGALGMATDVMVEIKRGRADFRKMVALSENGASECVKEAIENLLSGKEKLERVEALTKIAGTITNFGIRDEELLGKLDDMIGSTRELIEKAEKNPAEKDNAENAVMRLERFVKELTDKSAECVMGTKDILEIFDVMDEKYISEVVFDAYNAEEAILYTAVAAYFIQNDENFGATEKLSPYAVGAEAAAVMEAREIAEMKHNGKISESEALSKLQAVVVTLLVLGVLCVGSWLLTVPGMALVSIVGGLCYLLFAEADVKGWIQNAKEKLESLHERLRDWELSSIPVAPCVEAYNDVEEALGMIEEPFYNCQVSEDEEESGYEA